jgi:hypothetical protein
MFSPFFSLHTMKREVEFGFRRESRWKRVGGWGGGEKKTPERKAKMVCLEFPEEGELTDW